MKLFWRLPVLFFAGFALLVFASACSEFDLRLFTSQGRYDRAMEELNGATTEIERFYALGDAAKAAFEVEEFNNAADYAHELLELAPAFSENWNYGNAIHDAHIVLGRLALRDEERDLAKEHLLQAGETPGSPQLNSFGPNMSLARDLIEAEETDIVVEYFELCREFWEGGQSKLDRWERQVRDGRTPDFGANLMY